MESLEARRYKHTKSEAVHITLTADQWAKSNNDTMIYVHGIGYVRKGDINWYPTQQHHIPDLEGSFYTWENHVKKVHRESRVR